MNVTWNRIDPTQYSTLEAQLFTREAYVATMGGSLVEIVVYPTLDGWLCDVNGLLLNRKHPTADEAKAAATQYVHHRLKNALLDLYNVPRNLQNSFDVRQVIADVVQKKAQSPIKSNVDTSRRTHTSNHRGTK